MRFLGSAGGRAGAVRRDYGGVSAAKERSRARVKASIKGFRCKCHGGRGLDLGDRGGSSASSTAEKAPDQGAEVFSPVMGRTKAPWGFVAVRASSCWLGPEDIPRFWRTRVLAMTTNCRSRFRRGWPGLRCCLRTRSRPVVLGSYEGLLEGLEGGVGGAAEGGLVDHGFSLQRAEIREAIRNLGLLRLIQLRPEIVELDVDGGAEDLKPCSLLPAGV